MPSKGGMTDREKWVAFVEYKTGVPITETLDGVDGIERFTITVKKYDDGRQYRVGNRAAQMKAVRNLFSEAGIKCTFQRGTTFDNGEREIFVSLDPKLSSTLLLGALARAYPDDYKAFEAQLAKKKSKV